MKQSPLTIPMIAQSECRLVREFDVMYLDFG